MPLELLSEECSGVNPFMANSEQFYFQAPATLAIAVAVACALMWGRRLVALVAALADSYDVWGEAGDLAFLVAAHAMKLAARLPKHVQDALRSDLTAANPEMPSLPIFDELAEVLDRQVNHIYTYTLMYRPREVFG